MTRGSKFICLVCLSTILLLCASPLIVEAKRRGRAARKKPTESQLAKDETSESDNQQVRLKLADGTRIPVDDAWESPQGIWYRQSGVTHLVSRDRVKSIERGSSTSPTPEPQIAKVPETGATQTNTGEEPAWIYLKGGARFEADSATESAAGVWYRRGPLSVFISAAASTAS